VRRHCGPFALEALLFGFGLTQHPKTIAEGSARSLPRFAGERERGSIDLHGTAGPVTVLGRAGDRLAERAHERIRLRAEHKHALRSEVGSVSQNRPIGELFSVSTIFPVVFLNESAMAQSIPVLL
jgi:hypothetical protein